MRYHHAIGLHPFISFPTTSFLLPFSSSLYPRSLTRHPFVRASTRSLVQPVCEMASSSPTDGASLDHTTLQTQNRTLPLTNKSVPLSNKSKSEGCTGEETRKARGQPGVHGFITRILDLGAPPRTRKDYIQEVLPKVDKSVVRQLERHVIIGESARARQSRIACSTSWVCLLFSLELKGQTHNITFYGPLGYCLVGILFNLCCCGSWTCSHHSCIWAIWQYSCAKGTVVIFHHHRCCFVNFEG